MTKVATDIVEQSLEERATIPTFFYFAFSPTVGEVVMAFPCPN